MMFTKEIGMTSGKRTMCLHLLPAAAALLAATSAQGQDSDAEIAKKLTNPIASLVSVPFQLNWDQNIGIGEEGERVTLNVQPVIPFRLNDDWNLISRTIIPFVSLDDVPPGNDTTGTGDIVQSLFFSPVKPTGGGWIWGAGPVLLLPTASDALLGAEKLGVGPTVVALRQQNGWTYGALGNHIWSVAGDADRTDISASFVQPFLAYTTKTLTTFTLNTESTYDWKSESWSVPINLSATQLFRVGKQAMQLQLGARYWADTPAGGPGGWGLRVAYTLVFPK